MNKESNTRLTINAYNKNAARYTEKFDNYETYRNKIINFQRKYIPKGASILDLGCGPGNNINTILNQDDSCSFEGVDLSEEFIALARNRFPQFTFRLQNICNLDLQTKYDTVIASFCIVHLSDSEVVDFIEKLEKLLVDNGCLYLSYMNGDKSGLETTSFSKEKLFFNYYHDEFIIGLLEKNGISVLETVKENYVEQDGSVTVDTFIYAKRKK